MGEHSSTQTTLLRPVQKKQRRGSSFIFLHLAVATAIFVIAEVQFITRSTSLAVGFAVAVIGVMFFKTRTHPFLWAFPAAMLLTALWSPSPMFTIISTAAIVTPIVLAGTVTRICSPAQFLRTLSFWTRIALVLSFAIFILRPELGAHHDVLYDGAMRGLFAHKNGLARILVIGVFAEVFVAQRSVVRLFWLGSFLSAALLTQSLTFFALAAFVVLAAIALRSIKWRSSSSVVLFISFLHIAFAVLVVVAVKFGQSLVEMSGRFSAEDDRGRLWRGVLELVGIRPLTGWGYGQVFQEETEAGQTLWFIMGWIPSAAHNGYLNALAEGGIIGLVALIATLLIALSATWRARSVMLWPFIYAMILTINNMTDTRTGSVEWFILSAGVIYAASNRQADAGSLPEGANADLNQHALPLVPSIGRQLYLRQPSGARHTGQRLRPRPFPHTR